jgi:hypothetical protein
VDSGKEKLAGETLSEISEPSEPRFDTGNMGQIQ